MRDMNQFEWDWIEKSLRDWTFQANRIISLRERRDGRKAKFEWSGERMMCKRFGEEYFEDLYNVVSKVTVDMCGFGCARKGNLFWRVACMQDWGGNESEIQ